MIQFLDGPAAGHPMRLRRAPIFLRVVVDEKTGEVDALDQINDSPRPGEAMHAYRITEKPSHYHLVIRAPRQSRFENGSRVERSL